MILSHLSLEFVRVPVAAVINGVAYDPHLDVVQLAFPARGADPVSNDWKTGSWEAIPTDLATGATWAARCLVGPSGTVALAAGTYDVWLKVTDAPEVPIRKVGLLEVT